MFYPFSRWHPKSGKVWRGTHGTMAPFEQRREFLHRVYPLRDDSIDELRIEEISNQNGNKDNKHSYRDIYGDDPNYSDNYPVAATTAAISTPVSATSTSSIVYGSRTTQPPSSSVCLTEILVTQ